MTDDALVVSNTSPLLNLALIDRLDLVAEQFSTVAVPSQVWAELMAGTEGTEQLRAHRDAGTLGVVSVPESDLFTEFRRDLDAGESAALAYAVSEHASLILLDEREGRQAARRHGLSVTGVVGILLRAATDGDLDIETELDALRDAGFWISDELYRTAVDSVRSE